MHFHPQKCQTMHITNTRNIIQSTYTIHNHNLQTTNTAKYLGIHIHSTLIQPQTSTNLKQYNAAHPDTSCPTTIDMPASQPCSSTYTYLHYNNAASTSNNHHAIQNYTPTRQHFNYHLHHNDITIQLQNIKSCNQSPTHRIVI